MNNIGMIVLFRGIQKTMRFLIFFIAVAVIIGGNVPARADESAKNPFKGIKFETLCYVDYSTGKSPGAGNTSADYNRFKLTRGYFTFKKQALPWIGMRLTMDIHQDATGDYKVREKYFYAELRHKGFGSISALKSEIGLGHIPWLDFEEHINPYRCQGTMAVERAGVFNSADVGLSLRGYFGSKLEDAKEKTGNSHYAGRYGSWHLGIYNGGGYHSPENNENKAIEGRLTARPVPDILPGLQLSFFGIYGKGNIQAPASGDLPDYIVNLGMLSYEHPVFTLTGQYYATEGNAKGTWIDGNGNALKTAGYSVFGNVKIPGYENRFSVFGRFDYFDTDADNVIANKTAYTMIFGGIAFTLYKGNMILLVFETTDYEVDSAGKGKLPVAGTDLGDDNKIQAIYQIKL